MSSATVLLECPNCSKKIEIDQRWTAGGVNDYGGFVLRCDDCSHVFAHHLGRDINDTRSVRGASILDRYDDEMSNKVDVLKRHGLE